MPDNPNTAEPQKPRRRWFQFRLRTLLIVVALLGTACGYIGSNASIAMHRAAERDSLEQQGAFFKEDGVYSAGHAERRPSWLRELLGDHAVFAIFCTDDVQKEPAAEAFPESEIIVDPFLVDPIH